MTRYAVMVLWVSFWRILVVKDGRQAIYETREEAERVLRAFVSSENGFNNPKYRDVCIVIIEQTVPLREVADGEPPLISKSVKPKKGS